MSLVDVFPSRVDRMPLHLGKEQCDQLRLLTVARREFGVEFYVDDDCHLVLCTNLIVGTGADTKDPDAHHYRGSSEVEVAVASTPFYKEIFKTRKVCHRNVSMNMFGHTHPLLMFRDGYARLSPPSMGDMIAHTFLGTLRNWRENKQLNTMVILSYEGIYEYGITIPKFKELVALTESLLRAYPTETARQKREDPMELPEIVVERIKEHVFGELRGAANKMFDEMDVMCVNKEWSLKGAKEVDMRKWRCSECKLEKDCAYARNIDALMPKIVRFNKTNPFARRLRELGYYYVFHPWSDDGVTIDVTIKDSSASSSPAHR